MTMTTKTMMKKLNTKMTSTLNYITDLKKQLNKYKVENESIILENKNLRTENELLQKQLEFYKIHISLVYTQEKIVDDDYQEEEVLCDKCGDILPEESETCTSEVLNHVLYCKKCAVDYINFRDVIYLRNI
jgi:regulator of replication initiation timing